MKALTLVCLLALAVFFPATSFAGSTVQTNCPNVFVSSAVLPPAMKRVLVLPIACEGSGAELSGGCQILDPVLRQELIKTEKFEVVAASPETLRSCTGRLGWTGSEILPQDFFENLRSVYGCDGVMFCELTAFQSSAPLAIGWRLKLVDAATGKILWAADELFDANNSVVAKGAIQYEKKTQPHNTFTYKVYSFFAWCVDTDTRSALDDQWNILHSPAYFGQYAAKEVFQTLPQR